MRFGSARAVTQAMALLGLLFAGGACAGGLSIEMSSRQIQALGVETAPPVAQSDAARIGLPAKVTVPNDQMCVVSAPLGGLITSMAVAVNDAVRAGQVVARLDSPAMIEAQREFLHAVVRARLARQAEDRDRRLLEEGIIAQRRYLDSRGAAAQAAASLAQARHLLRHYGMSEAAIGKLRAGGGLSGTLTVVAPLGGVVLEQLAIAGQRAEQAAPLYRIAKLDPLWLDIRVPASDAAGIAPGTPVSVPAQRASGRVRSVGSQVSLGDQTVTVRALISSGASRLRPGQYVEARLRLPLSGAGAWRVPNRAIVRRQEKPYVFVRTPSGFRVVAVSILSQSATAATVVAPLRADERIAVSGLASLKAVWAGIGRGE